MHTSSMFSMKSSLPCSNRETSFPMQCCRPPLIVIRRSNLRVWALHFSPSGATFGMPPTMRHRDARRRFLLLRSAKIPVILFVRPPARTRTVRSRAPPPPSGLGQGPGQVGVVPFSRPYPLSPAFLDTLSRLPVYSKRDIFRRSFSENAAVTRFRRLYGERGGQAPACQQNDRGRQARCSCRAHPSQDGRGNWPGRSPERGSPRNPQPACRGDAPHRSLLSGDVQKSEGGAGAAAQTDSALSAIRAKAARAVRSLRATLCD